MKVVGDFQERAYRELAVRVEQKRRVRPLTAKDVLNVDLKSKPSNRVLRVYPPELCWLWSKDHEEFIAKPCDRRAIRGSRNLARVGGYIARFRYLVVLYRAGVFVGLLLRA